MSKKPDVREWSYSDDCAGFAPLKTDDSEYDVDGKWYSLFQGEERIGRIRIALPKNTPAQESTIPTRPIVLDNR